MSEGFKVPNGRMVKMCRHKVKRPRVTGFHIEGRFLMAKLSCGHSVKYCRVPKWTSCYQCPVETLHWEAPSGGYKEIPLVSERPQ